VAGARDHLEPRAGDPLDERRPVVRDRGDAGNEEERGALAPLLDLQLDVADRDYGSEPAWNGTVPSASSAAGPPFARM
jgi:hypothetical protein